MQWPCFLVSRDILLCKETDILPEEDANENNPKSSRAVEATHDTHDQQDEGKCDDTRHEKGTATDPFDADEGGNIAD
jgi:hypothetical protein